MAQQPSWQRFAGSVAEKYNRYLVPAIFEPWAEDLVALAALRPGARVLDVACGPGVVARLAARRAGGDRVAGLDINPGMVALARSLPSGLGISWREGSALQMPFADDSFDVVLCQQGLQFFADRAAGLHEMGRVLARDGRVVLAVWGPIEQSPGFAALAAALGQHVSAEAAAAAMSPFSLCSIDELRDLLDGAGWRNVEIHSREKLLHFPGPAEFVSQYVWASPVAAVIGEPDTSVLQAVIGDVADALQPYLDDQGLSFRIENHLAAAVRPSPTGAR